MNDIVCRLRSATCQSLIPPILRPDSHRLVSLFKLGSMSYLRHCLKEKKPIIEVEWKTTDVLEVAQRSNETKIKLCPGGTSFCLTH
jgi:hypothetical protein